MPPTVLFFLFLAGLTQAAIPATFDHDHTLFQQVLRADVREDLVDYARLKANPANLDAYLDAIQDVAPDAFEKWPRDQRLALLINLYNAQTLRLIIDHYPVASIRKIGFLPNSAWKRRIVRFGGRVQSLDDLEHGIIRAQYYEPRVHFALVCAALGCPPLRDEPYVAARLSAQLDDQARRFLSQTNKNHFDPSTRTLFLSPIFDWFAEDFTKDGQTVAGFVRPFLPESIQRQLPATDQLRIRFTSYDWNLNDLR